MFKKSKSAAASPFTDGPAKAVAPKAKGKGKASAKKSAKGNPFAAALAAAKK